MNGLGILARLHGAIPCAGVALVQAGATSLVGSYRVTAGWFTDLTAVAAPLASFLPAVCVLGFHSVTGPPYAGELNAARPLRSYRWLLLGALLGFAVLATLAATAAVGQPQLGVVAARNLVGSLGLALSLRRFLGDAAWLCPSLLALVELLFGASVDGRPAAWAWTLHPATSASALATAAVLTALGLLVWGPTLGREPGAGEESLPGPA